MPSPLSVVRPRFRFRKKTAKPVFQAKNPAAHSLRTKSESLSEGGAAILAHQVNCQEIPVGLRQHPDRLPEASLSFFHFRVKSDDRGLGRLETREPRFLAH